MAESEELSLLMKVKEESEEAGLELSVQKTKIMASGLITSWQTDGEIVTHFTFGVPESLQMVTAALKLKDAAPWKKSYDQARQHIKKQRHYFTNKGLCSQTKLRFFQQSCMDMRAGP